MSVFSTCLLVSLHLMSIEFVLSDILCKDSRIDSITYANDVQMYFFTSGGYYWWLKEKDFPPRDSAAKRLPSPFIMGHAAVYVDSDSGCASSLTAGVKAKEKEVWVEEYVGGEHKLMAFDTKNSGWRDKAIVYNEDHCISRAKIDWGSGKPLDAMFVRNYLEIYFVQGKDYAMVDCKFICSDPNNYGDDKPPQKTTDFGTVDPIYGMFVKKNKMLFMFHEKTFYEITIQPNSRNGKLVATKSTQANHIIKDFMKIVSPGECILSTTPALTTNNENKPSEDGRDGANAIVPNKAHSDEKVDDGSGGGGWSYIVIIMVVIVVISIILVIVFFVLKPKTGKTSDTADKEKAETPVVSSNAQKTTAKDGPGLGSNKPTSTLGASSTVTNKSNIGVVGIASKSSTSKTSTKK